MKYKLLLIILSAIFIVSCSRNEEPKTQKAPKKESLVEIRDGIFTEYYPGKKQKKFQGEQDENGQRQGKWTFYSQEGLELSITHYEHGIRHGHSIVKYPNGAIHYYGEYDMDKQIGIWKSYDQHGNLTEEKDYGTK
jgi:antitoxin component YwqK of YwqJK toxin-antitoxin module